MFDRENWKRFNDYLISDYGRVKSIKFGKERFIKQFRGNEDYMQVTLSINKKPKLYKVSRLVYMLFKGDIPDGMQVNHIDEDKNNNHISNLNLMTPKENSNWGTRNKRMAKALSKPVQQLSLSGDIIAEYDSITDASKKNNLSTGNISEACNNKRKTAGGFIWKYKV